MYSFSMPLLRVALLVQYSYSSTVAPLGLGKDILTSHLQAKQNFQKRTTSCTFTIILSPRLRARKYNLEQKSEQNIITPLIRSFSYTSWKAHSTQLTR